MFIVLILILSLINISNHWSFAVVAVACTVRIILQFHKMEKRNISIFHEFKSKYKNIHIIRIVLFILIVWFGYTPIVKYSEVQDNMTKLCQIMEVEQSEVDNIIGVTILTLMPKQVNSLIDMGCECVCMVEDIASYITDVTSKKDIDKEEVKEVVEKYESKVVEMQSTLGRLGIEVMVFNIALVVYKVLGILPMLLSTPKKKKKKKVA